MENKKVRNGFQKGTGCFTCDTCGKLTRLSSGDFENGSCNDCNRSFEIENGLSDGSEISQKDREFYEIQNKKIEMYNQTKETK